jgi:cyanophycinase
MTGSLFLLGGPGAYTVYGDEFVAAAGGPQARIVALVQTGPGWDKFGAEITKPWKERGVSRVEAVFPDADGTLDEAATLSLLQQATGIFIGGGHTPTYHSLYAVGPVGAAIRERHGQGVPVTGISAGALLAMQVCQFAGEESPSGELELAAGLGLAKGFVVGVHFSEWNALPEVLETMSRSRTGLGWGVDEPACLVCENGAVARGLGKSVYRIEMQDFETRAYTMTTASFAGDERR